MGKEKIIMGKVENKQGSPVGGWVNDKTEDADGGEMVLNSAQVRQPNINKEKALGNLLDNLLDNLNK